MVVVEMAGGLVTGLLFGLALGFIRPVVTAILALSIVAALVLLATGGVPTLINGLSAVAIEIGQHATFFAALAMGNLVTGALVLR